MRKEPMVMKYHETGRFHYLVALWMSPSFEKRICTSLGSRGFSGNSRLANALRLSVSHANWKQSFSIAGKGDREHLELPEAHGLLGSLLGMRNGPNPPFFHPYTPTPSPQACQQSDNPMSTASEYLWWSTAPCNMKFHIVWVDFCCPTTYTTTFTAVRKFGVSTNLFFFLFFWQKMQYNWSKVTGKIFMMLQKSYISNKCCSSYFTWILKNLYQFPENKYIRNKWHFIK